MNTPVTSVETAEVDHQRSRADGWRIDLLLGLTIFLLVGVLTQPWSAQPASRYLLTVALVDDHTVEIDPYEDYLGLDQARYDGHVYSDKAPVQPALAAVAYQLYRAAGGDAFPAGGPVGPDAGNNVGLWWVTLWSATLPAIALAITMRRTVAQIYPSVATRVTVGLSLGTVLLPFASQLFGHVLAALAVALAWYWLRRDAPTDVAAALAGLCLGLGIATEYTVAVVALVLLGVTVVRRQWRSSVALSIGTVVGTLPLMFYNWLTFDDPFSVSYQGHLPNFQGEGALGVYNLKVPLADEVFKALIGDRGLFTLTPIVTCAVVGCFLVLRRAGPTRTDAVVALTSLAAFVVVSTGIDGYGGDSPGPRYLIPVLPLLAVPLAEAWRRAPRICAAAAIFGGLFMLAATITKPLVDTDQAQSWRLWLQAVLDGETARNVLTGGVDAWVVYVATAAGLASLVALLAVDRRSRADDPPRAVAPTA